MGIRQDLEARRDVLELEGTEIERLLSAAQLAYYLNVIRLLLEEQDAAGALANYENNTLKGLMKLHGYEYTKGFK